MSHEVRTPINGIYGMFQLLRYNKFSHSPIYYDLIDKGRTSCNSLLSIVNDILDYSKIEAGKIELECIPFDIVDLVETAEFMFKDAASEKGIGLEFIFPREFNHYYKGNLYGSSKSYSTSVQTRLSLQRKGV
ncbi:MAG: hypothetical protein MK096_12270 [Oleiphilaceae bacterium]|nr:hypothetical protein [Oleiphilaceae bacterium]